MTSASGLHARILADMNGQPPRRTAAPAPQSKPRTSTPKVAGGRWDALNAFVDHAQRSISMPARIVWLTMYRNARRGYVAISQQRIAEAVGWTGKCAERIVRRYIRELIAAGLIRVEKRGSKLSGPSRYKLCQPARCAPMDPKSQQAQIHPPATGAQRAAIPEWNKKARRNRLPRFAASEADGQAEPSGLIALAVRNGRNRGRP